MIDCLDKQQQHLQLQRINASMNQHQSFTRHQPLNHQNQHPPPYLPPGLPANSVALPTSVYPQQQQQHHYPQQPQLQHMQQLQCQPQRTIVEVANHQQSGNELIGYYFGSISRDTAEWILKTHGKNMDGAYLLRSSGPNDDFVLSLMVNHGLQTMLMASNANLVPLGNLEVLHYKIVETEDSFVALHGQVGDEKFATIDELIDKAQGVATKPRWPVRRQSLESQILPPTYWGLTVDQVRLAILIKAKQWGFPLPSSLFQHQDQMQRLTNSNALPKTQQSHQVSNPNTDENQVAVDINVTTLNNETIRTLIYKSLHEFQPWFHGKISREEAERRIEDGTPRDGRFLVRERDNYSYALCISHKKTTKHYRIDVLPTGELAIQDGRKFTSLMALVSHYTIMSDGLWCALTDACPRPINGAKNGCCDKTPIPGSVPSNNDAFVTNSQVRVLPSNGICYSNNSNSAIAAAVNQQSLYCIPPITSNSNSNSNNNNSVQNSMVSGPISNFTLENSQANLHNYNSNISGDANQLEHGTTSSTALKSHSSLICSHQGGVVSIKAPIREWLQTINHKWSQLIASKNQHQSLNSFLFGNQNPLNNHCRYNHRDRGHPMNYRHRKCKNGHASCACIRQQMLTNRAAATAQAPSRGSSTVRRSSQHFGKLNEIDANQVAAFNRYQEGASGKNGDCCFTGANLFPQIKNQPSNGCTMPNNFINQNHSTFLENQSNNLNSTNRSTLLSRLPLNSGFTLSSESFIGSPLFAVKQAQLEKNKSLAGTGSQTSSGSGSGNDHTADEEKLISPVQSISGNLNNNPYNFDIYGSQTSTAVVNDQFPTSNSSNSSSGTVRLIQQALNSSNNQLNQVRHVTHHTAKVINQNDHVMAPAALAPQRGSMQAGPILCGQHAGPAFRYTNCNDENNYKPCHHRPHVKCRAADDSQLATSSTELACPSAMAKFVQFQDGQCLRTHRDTRSIQMAFLSSRPNNNGILHQTRTNSHVPLKELNAHHQDDTQFLATNKTTNWNGDHWGAASGRINDNSQHATASGPIKLNHPLVSRSRQLDGRNDSGEAQENSAQPSGSEIDLMDCGVESSFNFKYDPKLIKSSSIETLCGFGGSEEENFDHLVNCKSNTELIMTLQSCWMASQLQPQSSKILSPVQTTTSHDTTLNSHAMADSADLEHDVDDVNGESILSSLMVDPKQNEQLDHMKKKHDLDELTTNLLSELTASLKAQVDLKNKRSGFNNNLQNMEKLDNQAQHGSCKRQEIASDVAHEKQVNVEVNPLELINEFDTLIPNNYR